jgi:hypothetical protein
MSLHAQGGKTWNSGEFDAGNDEHGCTLKPRKAANYPVIAPFSRPNLLIVHVHGVVPGLSFYGATQGQTSVTRALPLPSVTHWRRFAVVVYRASPRGVLSRHTAATTA